MVELLWALENSARRKVGKQIWTRPKLILFKSSTIFMGCEKCVVDSASECNFKVRHGIRHFSCKNERPSVIYFDTLLIDFFAGVFLYFKAQSHNSWHWRLFVMAFSHVRFCICYFFVFTLNFSKKKSIQFFS